MVWRKCHLWGRPLAHHCGRRRCFRAALLVAAGKLRNVFGPQPFWLVAAGGGWHAGSAGLVAAGGGMLLMWPQACWAAVGTQGFQAGAGWQQQWAWRRRWWWWIGWLWFRRREYQGPHVCEHTNSQRAQIRPNAQTHVHTLTRARVHIHGCVSIRRCVHMRASIRGSVCVCTRICTPYKGLSR